MKLTEQEVRMLVGLLEKLEWPTPKEVFYMIMRRFISIPIELCVLDGNDRVLMFYRKDEEYDGYHMPGTVLRDDETVPQAIKRLIQNELVGSEVTDPKNIGWVEIPRGNGYGNNPTRHEISILFIAHLQGADGGSGGVVFTFDALPENTLPHHRVLAEKFRLYLENGKPILG